MTYRDPARPRFRAGHVGSLLRPAEIHAARAKAAVAEDMFAGVPVDGFFMEWDTDRAGGFEPLRFAPRDRMVVLGLVSSKFPELESRDDLRRRVDEAARYLPLENLCLSPQCGFASMAVGNEVSEQAQWDKLALVAETAAEIWGTA